MKSLLHCFSAVKGVYFGVDVAQLLDPESPFSAPWTVIVYATVVNVTSKHPLGVHCEVWSLLLDPTFLPPRAPRQSRV